MPELPEVETIKRGLAPVLENRLIRGVTLKRVNLRFDFPDRFVQRIENTTILGVSRRAKYLLFALSGGETLLCHLGMTGNFRFFRPDDHRTFEKHDHVIFELAGQNLPAPYLVYSDPRRFGFMDLFEQPGECGFLKNLGPEPLSNHLNGDFLARSFAGRRAPVKTLLLDQRILAGLGNIYVCEALFLSRIHPATTGRDLAMAHEGGETGLLDALGRNIRCVLEEALEAGGSTLKDFRNAEGGEGYFQHRFNVYDREGEKCVKENCDATVQRMVQSGRSSFFCPDCQPGGQELSRRNKNIC